MTTITLQTTPHQEQLITEDLKTLRKAQAEDDGYRVSFEDIIKKYAYEV